MNSREERRARRQEEKAARESYEQLCGEIEAELRRGREAKELRERRAAACERTGFDLRRPGEDLKTGDKAQDTIAEAESIVIWYRVLNIPIPTEPILLVDACRQVFDTWTKNKEMFLLNPISLTLSTRWEADMDKFPEGFEHRWLLVPNADTYFMSPEDFAPKVDSKPEPDPPLDESAAKVPTANEKLQQFIDNCGTAPVALFTSEVVPHEGSR